tara:strand:- start:37 stop:645 length:609 start_codon:yes stop_codon:yes gene_type:complete
MDDINIKIKKLVRFSSNEENGFNPSQTIQYFFPERGEKTNLENFKLYKNSLFMYIYRPTSPLYILNVKKWSAGNAKLLDLPVSDFFGYNWRGEIVRTKASDDPTIDNEFYKFILKKINETYEYVDVDGVYMHAYGTAHEEVVLQQSGVVKLEVFERQELPESTKIRRERERRERRERERRERRETTGGTTGGRKLSGRKINF